MKGWLIFAGIFLVGVLLIIAAFVYYVLIGGAEEATLPSRVLAVSGIVLVFGAIYGSAAWRFRLWWRTRDDHPPDKR